MTHHEYENLESFDTFLAIIARLRGPDGCPWDREQDHHTLKRYLVEECYETLDAIDDGPAGKLAEELGDVLLQIGLHAQIGSEAGAFTIGDVLQSINAKLLRRHPHVFGDVEVTGAEEVAKNWEEIKAQESGERASVLDGIPKSMPALAYSQETQRRAAKLGFEWPDINGVLDKVREELAEFEEAQTSAEAEHELGDIMAALVNVGRWRGVDMESAMRKANARFHQRFRYMEQAAGQSGQRLEDLPLGEQERLWQEAKRQSNLGSAG